MPKKIKIKAIIFDFDGTLAELDLDFNLMKTRVEALASAFLQNKPQVQDLPALEWIEQLAEQVRLENPGLELEFLSRCRLMITAMEMKSAARARLFPYTLETLLALKQRGVDSGIITRNCTAAVKKVFPDLKDYCDIFLARDDVPKVKPHPDHLLKAIELLKLQPEQVLMVGDHPIDIDTAKKAGTWSAGVYSGHQPKHLLLKSFPDFLAADVQRLLRQLIADAYL